MRHLLIGANGRQTPPSKKKHLVWGISIKREKSNKFSKGNMLATPTKNRDFEPGGYLQ